MKESAWKIATHLRHGVRRFAGLGVMMLAASPLPAIEYGLVSGSAGTPANWTDAAAWRPQGSSASGVPGAADNVSIGVYWNSGSTPTWINPAYVTLASGTQQVANVYLGWNRLNSAVLAQGTLNVTGAATKLTTGTLQMNAWAELGGNASGTLAIDAATVAVTNDANIATGGGLNTSVISLANGGKLSVGNNLTLGNVASVLANQATITLTGTSQLTVGNSLTLNGTNNVSLNLGPASRVVVTHDLILNGGSASTTPGTIASYNLALASTPTDGAVAFGRSLYIASTDLRNTVLTVGSGSASAMSFSGSLNIASSGQGPRGTLNLDGGGVNRTMTFAGAANLATGWGQNAATSNVQATLNLTNGARLNVGGDVVIGQSQQNNTTWQIGSATLNVDSTSQINSGGSLYLRSTGTYNLPLASAPANGMVSFRSNLYLADYGYGNVTLNVGNGSASAMTFTGVLGLANGTQSTAVLALDGNRSLTFSGTGDSYAAYSDDAASARLDLTNGAVLSLGGNFYFGRANWNVAQSKSALTLSGTASAKSKLNVGNSLNLNSTLSLDAYSQINVTHDLILNGGAASTTPGTIASYNLALAAMPTDGAVAFGRSLYIASTDLRNTVLTVGGGSAPAMGFSGSLNIASSGQGPRGTLNLDGGGVNRTMTFAGAANLATGWGQNAATSNVQATLNLTNGARLNVGGDVVIGQSQQNNTTWQIGSATLNVDSTSQINSGGSLYLRSTGTYNLPLASTPANGMVSFRNNLYLADYGYGNVTLNVGNGSASAMTFTGVLNLANGTQSTAVLALDGNRSLTFSGTGDSYAAYSDDAASARLNLTNGAVLSLGGNFYFGRANWNVAQSKSALTLSGTASAKSKLNVANSLNLNSTLSLDGFSQINVTHDLILNGGSASTTPGSVASYILALAAMPTDGAVAFERSLYIANADLRNVVLTVGGGSAPAMSFSGSLNIASSGQGPRGTLNLDGGGVNRTMTFAGAANLATGWGQSVTTSNVRATLNLTNGARLNVGGDVVIGQSQQNNTTGQIGSATLNVDSSSQFNSGGSLYLRSTGTYTLPLASAPANGMVSLRNSLYLADYGYGNVTLNVGNGSASAMTFTGVLNLANGTQSTAVLALDGNRTLTFAGTGESFAANGDDMSSAKLNLTNGAVLNLGGNFYFGRANWNVAQNKSALTLSGTAGAKSKLNVGNSLNLNSTLSLDAYSQINVTHDLILNGGAASTTPGSVATYSLALAAMPTDGAVSFSRSLYLANADLRNAVLTVGGGSAAAMSFAGSLNIATAGQGPRGTLNLDGGGVNRTMTFAGAANLATGWGQNATTSNVQATLNLTNGARLNLGGDVVIGQSQQNNTTWQIGSATLNVDSTSQINSGGSLYLRSTGTYNLPLASTPTNGMVSLRSNLYLADYGYGNVTLNIGSSSAAAMTFSGVLGLANGTQATAVLALDGGRTLTFAGTGESYAANGDDGSSARLNLTNGAVLNLGGNFYFGRANWNVAQNKSALTLSGTAGAKSKLNVGNSLNLNSTVSINSYAQVNMVNDLYLNGGSANATPGSAATYTLALAATPTDGAVSFSRSLYLANSDLRNTVLTVGSGSPAALNFSGSLNIATAGQGPRGTLNLDGGGVNRTMTFAGGAALASGWGNNATTSNTRATLNLTNGARLNLGGDVTLGEWQQNSRAWQVGSATINVDASSQMNISGSLILRGTGTYNLPLAATRSDGAMTILGSLYVADQNYNNDTLMFTGTAGTTLVSRGNINVATAVQTQGALTFNGIGMDLAGNGVFGQGGGDTGASAAYPNTAIVTLQNGAYLGFFGNSHLRNNAQASATLQGQGTYDGGNQFYMNGRVVASGGTLNIDFGRLYRDALVLTQGDTTQAGWYAATGGTLVLKTLVLPAATSGVTWGERPEQTVLGATHLINSVRLSNITDLKAGGLNGAIVAPASTTGLTNPVGVWSFQSANGLAFTDTNLTFRYDNLAAGSNESGLKLFRLTGGTWLDAGGTLDTLAHTLTAGGVANFGAGAVFAVATAGGAGTAPGVAGFAGNRETTSTYAAADANWSSNLNWTNRSLAAPALGAPQSRDTAVIGNGIIDVDTHDFLGSTVTLDDGLSHKTGSVLIGRAEDATHKFSQGTLLIENGSTLRLVQDLQLANDDSTIATLKLTKSFGVSGSILDVGNNIILGHGTKTVVIDADSQLNMIGVGGTLYLDNEEFNTADKPLAFAATPTGGKLSVTPSTNLQIRSAWTNDAALNLGPESNGVQFNNLYLAQDNTLHSGTLNVYNTTITFNGSAGLGGRINGGNDVYNAGHAIVNVTGSGVLNIGGGIYAGGYGQPNWTGIGASINLDATAQINMTGIGTRLDLREGTYGLIFTNTPANGKFSVKPSTDLWLGNAVQEAVFHPKIEFLAGSDAQFNQLLMAWNDNSYNAAATLNVKSAASVTFNGDALMGRHGTATVSIANGGAMNVLGSANLAGQSSLVLTGSGQFNVGADLSFGGQDRHWGKAAIITLDPAAQINMTGVGRTLTLIDGNYSGLGLSNLVTNGKVSVPASTTLAIRQPGADAVLTLGPEANGIQFNNLNLAQDNTLYKGTLNIDNSTVTFNGSAGLGGRINNGNDVYNTGTAVVNVTGSGVLNIGGGIYAGGYGQPNWTGVGASINLDATAQINMTGVGTRLDLREGTYGFIFTGTPANGKFSIKPSTELWLGNAVQDARLQPKLEILTGSDVQFSQLLMAWNDNSYNAAATLNVKSAAAVTINGDALMGRHGTATVSIANGGAMNVIGSANLGGQSSLALTGSGQFNVGADLSFGGQDRHWGYAALVTLDPAAQINMTGAGRTLTFMDGSYNGLSLSNVVTNGKVSVPESTTLTIRQPGGDAVFNLGPEANGIQFNNLNLAQDNSLYKGTLNINNTTVTFTGSAGLGGRINNGNDVYNAGQAILNVTGSSVLNIGGGVYAGGYGQPNWTGVGASINLDATAQINMTGKNTRLDLREGSYGLVLTNTPANGKFSLNPSTELWLGNAVQDARLQPKLEILTGSDVQFSQLLMAWNDNSYNAAAILNVKSAASVTINGDALMGRHGTATVSIANGGAMNVLGSASLGGQSSLALTGSGQLNVGADLSFGGLDRHWGYAALVTLDPAAQINMTGASRTLTFIDGSYNGLNLSNVASNGKVSLPASTSLSIRQPGANVVFTLGAEANGVQFNNLNLAQDNTLYKGTLNIDNSTVTFNGSAGLGGRINGGNDVYNTGQATVNVTGSGVLNIGGSVYAGGYGQPNWTGVGASINLDATAQFNMTGTGTRLDLREGTYGLVLTNTPANGKFSLKPSTDLWLGNMVQEAALRPKLELLANSSVQFNQLRMAVDGNSANSVSTLNVASAASVTFNGEAYVGGQGKATLGIANGAVINFNQSVRFGDGSKKLTVVQGAGQINVSNTLYNDGRIVADGAALNLSYATLSRQTSGSLSDASFPGWYAQNAGSLNLPGLVVTNSTTALNWGERGTLTALDISSLVNSLRITSLTGGTLTGSLGISLLAPTNAAVKSGLVEPVGIWSFTPADGLSISSATLTFRYDSLLAGSKESTLNLFENSGNGWQLLTSSPTSLGNHLISGVGTLNSPSQFALAQWVAATSTSIWNGGGSNDNWQSAANWGGTLPLAGAALRFGPSARATPNNDLAAGASFGGIEFDAGAPHFTLGGNAIALAGNITNNSSNNQTINQAIALVYGVTSVDTGSNTIALAGNLSNGGSAQAGLIKKGAGTLVLSGSNSHSGPTKLSAGTLSVATLGNGGVTGSNFGPASNAAANLIFDGGTLQYTGLTASTDRNFTINPGKTATFDVTPGLTTLSVTGAAATTDGGLAKTGPGILILTGANAYSGSTSVSGGKLQIGNGGSGATIGSTSGVVLSNNSSLAFNHADAVIFSKPVSGSGSLSKAGTGTLSVGTPQTYSGATHVAGGTLKLLARPVLTVTANLQLQLDAFDMASLAQNSDGTSAVTTNGQAVGYWSDKSGAGHHANVTTTSKRPVYTASAFNGMPALNFDSAFAQEIWANYNIANGSAFTIAIVYRQTSLAGGNHALFGNDNGGWDRFQGLAGGANYGISNGGWQNYGQATAMNNTDPIRYVFVSRPGVTNGSEIWVNGLRVAQFTEGHDGSNTAQIAIGNISPNNGWNGNIQVGEVVAYGSALSDADRSTLDTYLNSKWFGGGGGSSGINLLPTDTPVAIASGAALNLNGVSQQVAALADSGGGGGSVTNGGTDDATLTISGASSTSFSGVISNGATNKTALVKTGAGTLTLTGTSTYTGATNVSGGNLRVHGALGATATSVSATLSGNGSINAGVNLLAGGAVGARISDWTGAAGSGFDDLSVESLAIAAGSHSITIDTTGLTNFADTYKVFALVKTTGGITGFNAGSFSVTAPGFGGAGTWSVRQTGNNLELVYSNGVALPPYENWAVDNGLSGVPGKEAAFDADPDKDGISNGLEWILGGKPLLTDRSIQPSVTSSAASGLTLRFTRGETSIGQATLVVQWATHLNGTWTEVPVSQGGGAYDYGVVVTVNQVAAPDAVTVNIPAANAAAGKIFARLKATNP